MAGYTRQSSGLITTGATILASHHENEFVALAAAFDGSTGHTHDGTAGNGPEINLTTSVTDKLPIANGGTNATVESAARTNLGLEIGTDVQAYDAGLQSIAGLTTSADKMVYTTASDTYATTDLTSFARTILDDADASTVRTTLGLGSFATANTPSDVNLEIGVDVQAYDANTAKTDVAQEYSKAQNFNATTLSDGANISWNLEDNQVASVTLGGNRTLDNPTNMQDGGTYILIVNQDGTGSRTLSFGSAYKWQGGTAPTLSTGSNAVDILSFVSDGTNMYGIATFNFS